MTSPSLRETPDERDWWLGFHKDERHPNHILTNAPQPEMRHGFEYVHVVPRSRLEHVERERDALKQDAERWRAVRLKAEREKAAGLWVPEHIPESQMFMVNGKPVAAHSRYMLTAPGHLDSVDAIADALLSEAPRHAE